jgi:hypothetical protein
MPEYSVEVIDLGLRVEQGLELGVEAEEFVRSQALGDKLLRSLLASGDALALEFFTGQERKVQEDGKQKTVWDCKRIELDALTSQQVVSLIENQLKEEGVYGKVVPPEDELPFLAEDIYRKEADRWAEEALEELVSWGAIKEALASEFIEKFKLENSERYIRAKFKKDDALSWREALRDVLTDIQHPKHTGALKEAVREKIAAALVRDEGNSA